MRVRNQSVHHSGPTDMQKVWGLDLCWHVTHIHCSPLRSPSFCSRTTRVYKLLPKASDGFLQTLSYSQQGSFSHRIHWFSSSASQSSTPRAQPAMAQGASDFSRIRLYVYVDVAIVETTLCYQTCRSECSPDNNNEQFILDVYCPEMMMNPKRP